MDKFISRISANFLGEHHDTYFFNKIKKDVKDFYKAKWATMGRIPVRDMVELRLRRQVGMVSPHDGSVYTPVYKAFKRGSKVNYTIEHMCPCIVTQYSSFKLAVLYRQVEIRMRNIIVQTMFDLFERKDLTDKEKTLIAKESYKVQYLTLPLEIRSDMEFSRHWEFIMERMNPMRMFVFW
jgi:hypothetical protein